MIWTILLLSLAGFAGNYLGFSLFFGVDFLLGSVAVMLAVQLLGPVWGTVVAVIAGSYTWFLWHHPYAIVVLAAEAACVGILLRRVRQLILANTLFWLLIGMPLVWLLYTYALDVEASQVQLIMLKDAINGVFNALLASLLLIFSPLQRWLTAHLPPVHSEQNRDATSGEVSLSLVMFNLLMSCVLFPSLLLTIWSSRETVERIETDIQNNLRAESVVVTNTLRLWHRQHLQAVEQVAQAAATKGVRPSPELQQATRLVARSHPDFLGMYVANDDARAVAVYPERDSAGRSILGRDYSDRPYFKTIRTTLQPHLSPVLQGRVNHSRPLVALSVPIVDKTGSQRMFRGYAAGALDLNYLEQILNWSLNSRGWQATLVDEGNRIVATTHANLQPMQSWRRFAPGSLRATGNDLQQWLPQTRNMPAMVRWRDSIFLRQSNLAPQLPWKLVVEAPLAPHYQYLQQAYLQNLLWMLALTVASLILASVLSRQLTRPLWMLTHVTHDLPTKILSGATVATPALPAHSVQEINALVRDFQVMESTLRQNFHDIQSTQGALEVERERLAHANRLKDEFLSVLSHELRTPLSPILGYAHLLAHKRLTGDDATEAAFSIERNARDQLRLIEDLLDVSRIIMGKLRVEVALLSLHEVVMSAMETVQLMADKKNITIDFQERGTLPFLNGDEARLRQVVWNLLTNSIKFSPEGGRIEVTLEQVGQDARIAVCDNGKGIAPEFLPYVFERFRQADDYLTRSAGGLGLGLAIVRHLVELHGGRIEAYSAGIGQGATFTVYLPLHHVPVEDTGTATLAS
jgi:signal transduction histidine kinase